MRILILLPRPKIHCKIMAYLWIQIIDARDGVFHVAPLQSLPNIHTTFDTLKVNRWREVSFLAKFLCCRLVTFNHQVVHHKTVQVSNWDKGNFVSDKQNRQKNFKTKESANTCNSLSQHGTSERFPFVLSSRKFERNTTKHLTHVFVI